MKGIRIGIYIESDIICASRIVTRIQKENKDHPRNLKNNERDEEERGTGTEKQRTKRRGGE